MQNLKSRYFSEILHAPHLVKSIRIWSFSDPYFPAFGLNTERYSVFLPIQSECGKIRTRKTPNTDTFHKVHIISVTVNNWSATIEIQLLRIRLLDMSAKEVALKNFPKFTKKTILEAVSLELYKDKYRCRCPPVNFATFFRTPANIYLFKVNHTSMFLAFF